MAESKPERKIEKRFDQTLTAETRQFLGIPKACADCPRVAFEYCEQRNKSADNAFKAGKADHDFLIEALTDFSYPTSGISETSLQDLLGDYMKAVREYEAENPFRPSFAAYLESVGTQECEGVIIFDEPQLYLRRYTRDELGRPVPGDATAMCGQDSQYVRDSKGYADKAFEAVEL